MDWANIIEVAGVVLGSGASGSFVTWWINRKKHRNNLRRQNVEIEAEIHEKLKAEVNALREETLELSQKSYDLEKQLQEQSWRNADLEKKYETAVDELNQIRQDATEDNSGNEGRAGDSEG